MKKFTIWVLVALVAVVVLTILGSCKKEKEVNPDPAPKCRPCEKVIEEGHYIIPERPKLK